MIKNNENNIENLKNIVAKFRDDRDWKQFHTPKNLAMALSVEASELSEIFLWSESRDSYNRAVEKMPELKEEMADVFIYLLSLADVLNVDIEEAVLAKIDKNNKKYPVEKAKGSSKKYNEL